MTPTSTLLANSSLLFKLASLLSLLSYPLIFVALMFEGEITFFTIAFLTQQGLFNPFSVFVIAFAGAMAGDILWFWFGRKFQTLHIPVSFLNRWMSRLAKPIDNLLLDQTNHTLLVSKFAYGFNHLTLMRAAMLGIKFRKIFKIELIATFLWILVIGSLGYFAGASFELIRRYLKYGEFAILFFVLAFFAVWHFVLKRRLEKEL